MFEVKVGSKELVCTARVKLLTSSVLKVAEAVCEVVVPLGVSSDSKAVKRLLPDFETRLKAAAKRAQGFLTDIETQSKALEKMVTGFNDRPAVERSAEEFARLRAFVERENDAIGVLWKRWCEIHAPKMANEALAAVAKAAADKDLRDLASARKEASGKASKLPALQIVAGAVSIAAGGVPGAIIGTLKVAAAFIDHQRGMQKALQAYADEQADVVRDLADFRKAVEAMKARVERVDHHRTQLQTQIIGKTSEGVEIARKLKAAAAASTGSARADVAALSEALAGAEAQVSAMAGRIVDPEPMMTSLKAIEAQYDRMAAHARASVAAAGAASKDIVPVLKTLKESGDIVKGLMSLAD
jgi:hypothetical protein